MSESEGSIVDDESVDESSDEQTDLQDVQNLLAEEDIENAISLPVDDNGGIAGIEPYKFEPDALAAIPNAQAQDVNDRAGRVGNTDWFVLFFKYI